MPLGDDTSRYEVEQTIRVMANCKAVGSDGLPVELLKALANEGTSDTLVTFYDTIVAM